MSIIPTNANTLVIGVKNEAGDVEFAKKIESFFRNEGTHFCFVHAMEEKTRFPGFYGDILGSFDFTELGQEPGEAEKLSQRGRLQALQSYLQKPDDARMKLLECDDPAEALLEEAQIQQAPMIVIETQEHLYQMIPRGLSVPLSLMQKSPVPVLILRQGSANRFEQKHRDILVADDLSPGSYQAVRKALLLAARWGQTRVVHLHVVEERMHFILDKLRSLGKKMDLVREDNADLADFFRKSIEAELQKRTLDLQYELQKAGCTYETRVEFGPVSEKVLQTVEQEHPDLVIFGRSSGLRPLGGLSFSTMLKANEAVLLVP